MLAAQGHGPVSALLQIHLYGFRQLLEVAVWHSGHCLGHKRHRLARHGGISHQRYLDAVSRGGRQIAEPDVSAIGHSIRLDKITRIALGHIDRGQPGQYVGVRITVSRQSDRRVCGPHTSFRGRNGKTR